MLRAGGPPAGCPRLPHECTAGDDRVGEVEVRVDDGLVPLVAALQPAEAVVPGAGPLDVPPLPGPDRGLIAFTGDSPGHAAGGELVAGLLLSVPGVEVHPDVVGQRAEVVEFVQRLGASTVESRLFPTSTPPPTTIP